MMVAELFLVVSNFSDADGVVTSNVGFLDRFLTMRFTNFFFFTIFVFFVFGTLETVVSFSSVSKSFKNFENSSSSSRQSTLRTSSSSRTDVSRFSASVVASGLPGAASASESVTSTSVSVSTSSSSSLSSSSLPDSNRLNLSFRGDWRRRQKWV